MVIWFLALAIAGFSQLVQTPGVLAALNPIHALRFLVTHDWAGIFALGEVS